jgi:hypothetical protein
MVVKGESTHCHSPGQGHIVPWSGMSGMLPGSGWNWNLWRKSPPGRMMKTVLDSGSTRHDNEDW